jgi:N6-L-threonylcarbamoyladenine synthase
MYILGIETSADDTCAAVLKNDRILSNVISSQVDLHQKWGGIVPDIAKRAHQERIFPVIAQALQRAFHLKKSSDPHQLIARGIKKIDFIGVTQGPGLSIALEAGINAAKTLAIQYKIPLIAANHIEGHLLSPLLKNSQGNPKFKPLFPTLVLTVSGGHTKTVLIKKIGDYETIAQTLDDAGGEALDKSAKLIGLSYPGGPIIERLAKGGNPQFLDLPRPLSRSSSLDYSFSGLKTAFYYHVKDWSAPKISKNLSHLSASIQKAVFDTLLQQFKKALKNHHPKSIFATGGVMANQTLRRRLRALAKKENLPIFFPLQKELNTDNAAMIALVAYYQSKKKKFIKPQALDRLPRLSL